MALRSPPPLHPIASKGVETCRPVYPAFNTGALHLAGDRPRDNLAGKRAVLRHGRGKRRGGLAGDIRMGHGIDELAVRYGDNRLAERLTPIGGPSDAKGGD